MRVFLATLILTLGMVLFSTNVSGETATSSNLLPNGAGCNQNYDDNSVSVAGVGCSGSGKNLSTGDTTNQGFDVRSGTGYEFGTSGTQDLESNGNITIGSSGSLENLNIITENATSHTTTTDSLDGGVTLKSTTETQNCEWSGSSYQCGQARSGRDTFTVRVQIKDASGNVLATVEQQRNTDAGYYSNTAIHEDTVTYTGEGSRSFDWQWSGTDGNNPNATSNRQGPNLVGAALYMTLADVNYTPTPPISEETQEEINEANEAIEEVEEIIENIPIEEIVEGVEEVAIEEPTVEVAEPTIEEPTVEIEQQAFQESFEENFTAILEEEGLQETFEQALEEEGITEEQFFESVTEMVTEEFSTPTESEPTVEEPTVEEEAPVEESPVVEEEPTTETETVNTTEESVETETEPTESEPSTETSPEPETSETETESTEGETESSESEEAETTEQEESTSNEEESVEDSNEEASTDEQDGADTSVDTDSVESAVSEIQAKVEKVLKKLESKLKTMDQKLKVISIVTLQGMVEDQPDMTEYTQMSFYDTRKLEDNPDWYAEDTILNAYGRSIYQDKTLIAYQTNDPVFQHTESINRVNETISRLEAELEVLENELNE